MLMLVVKHMPDMAIEKFIDTMDLSVCIDTKDKSRLNALLHLCIAGKSSPLISLLFQSIVNPESFQYQL